MKPLANSFSFSRFRFCRRVFAVVLTCAVGGGALLDSARAQSASPTPEQEARFVATLTNATLKGRFCGIKDGALTPEKEDSYTIASVTKLGGDKWTINAQMPYGGKTVELPIPAVVKWAGDTPVMIFDNISMGTPRAYSARVMIYEKTYSGWWTAPDHGGLLTGIITNAAK